MTARRVVAVLSVLLAAATAACSEKASNTSKPMDSVTYLTGLGATGRESFAWVAKAKGYFKDAGINATVKPGSAGDSNVKLLDAGQAQFAIVDYSGQLVRAGTGADTSTRVIAAIHQRTITSLMALEGSGISKPADLQGKTIAQPAGASTKMLFPAYAKLAGFDPSTVKWVDAASQQLPAVLASGKVDAVSQWVPAAPTIQAAANGRGTVTLPFGDYLTDLYGNVLISEKSLIDKNPGLVKRFRSALLKGLQYSVDHPEEAGKILNQDQAAVDPKTASQELVLMRPYVSAAADREPLGAMDETRVARSIALLQSLGLTQPGLTAGQVIDLALTRGAS